jgi:hypothetical protein
MTHVDEWLDTPTILDNEGECYAKFVLDYKRMPAYKQTMYEPYMKQFKLFCMYKDVKYRVTGASRLGDVWLTTNFEQEHGYEKRIDVADCSEWSKK